MENNTQPVTAQELSNVAMHPRTGFPSEEAMKAYYLQLIDIMNIAYVKESSERYDCEKNAALFWNFRESMYYSLSENLYLCGQFENRSE